jgi:hypothetical protein
MIYRAPWLRRAPRRPIRLARNKVRAHPGRRALASALAERTCSHQPDEEPP